LYIRTRWVILGLVPIFAALPALSQQAVPTPSLSEASVCCATDHSPTSTDANESASARNRDLGNSSIEVAVEKTHPSPPDDFNRSIFYRNKLEFSLDAGWLPINVPFPFDFMLKSEYNTYPLKYTLVPAIASLRWQLGKVRGPVILRGNWDLEFSGTVVSIPRGPETRNFVPRNWRVTPYFDFRLGLGNVDAKGPLGIPYAQGQDFTFTLNMGSGLRYNFNPRYAMTLGLNWMHISNANLSEGKPPNWGYRNYGINVYGPIVGIDMQLRRNRAHPE